MEKTKLARILAAARYLLDADADCAVDAKTINDLGLVLSHADVHVATGRCPCCWAKEKQCRCEVSTYKKDRREHRLPEHYHCSTWEAFDAILIRAVAKGGPRTRPADLAIWEDFIHYCSTR